MNRSHIPLRQLIRQLDRQRSDRKNRDKRPRWLVEFIDRAADLFEPADDIARVGFHCQPQQDRWEVMLYLGRTEIVGGPCDGAVQPAGFQFDVRSLLQRFSEVTDVQWFSAPPGDGRTGTVESSLAIDGLVGGNPLRVQISALPPEEAGPGLRRYLDGRCQPA